MYNPAIDTFIRVAELGSFSKAAEESYISPSAVIQQINHLEGTLNVRLFVRSKKGVTLTQAGEYFLLESKALIQRCSDIRSHLLTFSEHAAGSVLFGTKGLHRLKSGHGIHTKSSYAGKTWNKAWGEYIKAFPNATAEETLAHLRTMERNFGIVKYKARRGK